MSGERLPIRLRFTGLLVGLNHSKQYIPLGACFDSSDVAASFFGFTQFIPTYNSSLSDDPFDIRYLTFHL